ncbi:peptidyl-dipeptidase [Wielerella bovis]|uniref:peptidyl-dipeptidase n=1 Tax=Wielerella bovis TaxID=2917790 RepID=UPI0020197D3D|nr:peptidyl-dipeptidase [Wielerella bovis]MCG7657178.1 peptidyl-dipeptidase [Wielerella bovis]MCG7659401.1 peptidyl-dipeptidase [Wielerella bovis]ULJ59484.1 peptidyl-dipeptidase [Wielerella bovis]ULJ68351.1 peptidyl-dipeptidase [Wielerella bovis]
MKNTLLLAAVVVTLAACADTRSHITSDSGEWNRIEYGVGKDTQELTEQQQAVAKQGEHVRSYQGGTPNFQTPQVQVHHESQLNPL